jgi:hypothetical protein
MGISHGFRYDASILEVAMLQRGFMGAFDIKPDRVAFATSATNAASIGADFQPRKNFLERLFSVVCDVHPGEGLGATCRSQRRKWWSGTSARMQPSFTSSKSQSISWNARDRAAEQATSSQPPECIYRTNDHAPIPAGESHSGA